MSDRHQNQDDRGGRTEWESEAFLNSIIENIPHMIFVKDAGELKFVRFNKAGEDLVGVGRDSLIGKSDADFFPKEQADFFNEKDREVLRGKCVIDVPEEPLQSPRGTRYLHTKKIPILDADGKPQYLLGISEDITDRKETAEQNRRLSAIIESSPDLIAFSDPDGSLRYMNAAGRRMLGLTADEPMMGKKASAFHPASAAQRVFEEGVPTAIREGSWSGETLLLLADGTELPVSQVIVAHRAPNGQLQNISTVIRDISELKRLNEAAFHARKMEAASTLAAGTAHEFNNLHTTILMAAGIIKDQVKKDPDLAACVDEILGACERATALTRRLLAFARQDRLARATPVNLNELIVQETKTMRSVLGENRRLVVELGEGTLPVAIDPRDLSQILFNLAENARDAMPNGGVVTVRTERLTVDGPGGGDVLPGTYTRLTFSDTGGGMTDEVKAHLFEPFFTTKGRASGTGLGLAALYGIVKRLGGVVRVESSPGKGASFLIYMPAVPAAAPSPAVH